MTTTETETKKFDIYDATGMRRIYKNCIDGGSCYCWESGFGFIDKMDIQRDGLIVVPASGI